ncbi:hydrolase, partial [Vibrio vulnificus]
DVFQALSQDRPYRPRMPQHEIEALMTALVDDGKLCPTVFGALKRHLDDCYQMSIQDSK